MSVTTTDDVIALVRERPGIGLNDAIEELGRRAATLHPLPSISESIMATLKDGRMELTIDRLLRLT